MLFKFNLLLNSCDNTLIFSFPNGLTDIIIIIVYVLLYACSRSSIAIIFIVNDWNCLKTLFLIKKEKLYYLKFFLIDLWF